MDLGGMAEMLQGMGGGGPGGGGAGGGGLSDLVNNPMMMQMAQQMMGNGGLERLMQNPSVANMVGHRHPMTLFSMEPCLLEPSLNRLTQMSRVQSGGGMPSMAELMSDPGLREL